MIRKLFIIALSILSLSTMAKNKITIEHVEPPMWWIGMNNEELMIMVHGQNIGSLIVDFEYEGVELNRVTKTENSNYLFLYLTIQSSAKPGTIQLDFKKSGKVVLQHEYLLKQRKPGSAERSSFGPQDVIYLLMPDRFSDGNPEINSTDDTIEKVNRKKKDGRHGGDLQGIINKLDYLEDLGITAIWPTPVLEDNMDSVSYHTYAITDLYKIDPRYGSNEDYVRFSAEAKKRGIKLIQDMVPNHIGSNHWWMSDLPTHDWVHHHPEFTYSNHRKEVWHDPYVSKEDMYYNETGWFDTSMPDLNQSNPLLLTYLKQQAIWWIEYADLDGLRVDTYPYVDQWEAAEWTKGIRNEYPNLNIVGECWLHHPSQIAYWQTGVKNANGYDSQLPSVMDFPWQGASQIAFNEDDMGWDKGMIRFYNNFAMDYMYANTQNIMIFLDNHDTHRIAEALEHDVKKMKLALTHLLTTRGIPQFYYGTEIMLGGDKQVGDDDIRREIPGGWEGDERDAFTKEGRTTDENEVFNFTRKLLNYRKNNAVLHTGKMMQFVPKDNVYVYFRYNNDKTVMVIINNSMHEKEFEGARFQEILHGFSSAKNVLTERSKATLDTFRIKPKTSQVLELY